MYGGGCNNSSSSDDEKPPVDNLGNGGNETSGGVGTKFFSDLGVTVTGPIVDKNYGDVVGEDKSGIPTAIEKACTYKDSDGLVTFTPADGGEVRAMYTFDKGVSMKNCSIFKYTSKSYDGNITLYFADSEAVDWGNADFVKNLTGCAYMIDGNKTTFSLATTSWGGPFDNSKYLVGAQIYNNKEVIIGDLTVVKGNEGDPVPEIVTYYYADISLINPWGSTFIDDYIKTYASTTVAAIKAEVTVSGKDNPSDEFTLFVQDCTWSGNDKSVKGTAANGVYTLEVTYDTPQKLVGDSSKEKGEGVNLYIKSTDIQNLPEDSSPEDCEKINTGWTEADSKTVTFATKLYYKESTEEDWKEFTLKDGYAIKLASDSYTK